ncbi:MAG: sulfotransferase [Planctomycetota bacterium]
MPLGEALNAASRLQQSGDLREAERILRELGKQAPKSERLRGLLAITYLGQNLPLRAWKTIATALRGAEEPGTLVIGSRVAKRLLRLEDTRRLLERAIQLDRSNTGLRLELSTCLTELGLRDEAAELLDAIIAKDPRLTSAHWQLALLDLVERDEEHLAQMNSLLEEGGLSKRDRVPLHFACARILQRRDAVDREFHHLNEASATVLAQRPWNAEIEVQRHEKIRAFLERGMGEAEGGLQGGPDLAPLLVTSMPRSGSTLMESILGAHPAVAMSGEWGFFHAWTSDYARSEELASLDELWSSKRPLTEVLQSLANFVSEAAEALQLTSTTFTEKSISNVENLPFMLLAFPRAKVVHVQRDPLDAALSAYQLHFGGPANQYTYDLRAFAKRYRQHTQFMDAWRALFPDRIHDVQYEDLVRQPEEVLPPVLAFCGLDWDPACLRFHENTSPVLTASNMQVRRPLYTSAVGKHVRYGKLLAPAAEELGIEITE